jgi:hypothetical protein
MKLETERTFVFYVDIFNRTQFVPESEACCDDETDEDTDQKKPAVGREGDEEDGNDDNGDEEGGGTLQTEAQARPGSGRHTETFYADGGMRAFSMGQLKESGPSTSPSDCEANRMAALTMT